MIDSYDILVYTALFMVPGYLYQIVLSWFGVQRKDATELFLVRCLFFGIANFVAVNTVLALFGKAFAADPSGTAFDWRVFVIVIPGPLILGVISGVAYQKDWLFRAMRFLTLKPMHPVATAWEYAFTRFPQSWVKVHLEDGSNVMGVLAEDRIFASSDREQRDLLLIGTFCEGAGDRWEDSPQPGSVWLRADQIAKMEFFWDTEGHDGQAQEQQSKFPEEHRGTSS